MLQSLRARLAFLFAGTLVLATVIAAVVVVSLYRSYNRDQTVAQLRNQVGALASYYQNAFNQQTRKGGGVRGQRRRLQPDRSRPGVLRRAAALSRVAAVHRQRRPADTDRPAEAGFPPDVPVPSEERPANVHRRWSADLPRRPARGSSRPCPPAGRRQQRLEERHQPGRCRPRGGSRRRPDPGDLRRPPDHPSAPRDRQRGRQGRPWRPRRERGRQAQLRRRARPARHTVPGHGRPAA